MLDDTYFLFKARCYIVQTLEGLAVDSLVAVLALSWSSTAAAAKVSRETGTLGICQRG